MSNPPNNSPFSAQLETWLKSDQPKTLAGLTKVFSERSFAVVFLLLMFLPALPIPTGGVTHVFELITMLLALELVVGRRTIWLPKRLNNHGLGNVTQKKTLPFIIRRVRWFEKFSRPRLTRLLDHRLFLMFTGLIVFGLTLGAFLSPPFSGLDTLPSMGVVVIALSLILGDIVIFVMGCVVGLGGVVVEIAFGAAVTELIKRLF